MSGRLAGKVAFITGAARGQGRAHAVRMAEEGADIIAVDIAGKLPSCVPYPPATEEDLAETVRLVEATNRRILTSVVDTRDFDGLRGAVDDGVAALGRLDIIVANAGIAAPQAWDQITPEAFRDVMDVNVQGTWNTVMAGADKIIEGGRGGSIILISSAAGLAGIGSSDAGSIGYAAAKHGLVGLMRVYANHLAQHSIRVNSVHPAGVAPSRPVRCEARLRYHAPAIPGEYRAGRLVLDEPFLGAAPGQAAVLYSGSRVLGGGIIASAT